MEYYIIQLIYSYNTELEELSIRLDELMENYNHSKSDIMMDHLEDKIYECCKKDKSIHEEIRKLNEYLLYGFYYDNGNKYNSIKLPNILNVQY